MKVTNITNESVRVIFSTGGWIELLPKQVMTVDTLDNIINLHEIRPCLQIGENLTEVSPNGGANPLYG